MKSQRSTVERKRGRYIEMFADGTITRVERDERLERVASQLASLDEELARLESTAGRLTMDDFYELFGVLFDRWAVMTKEERRKLLALHMPKIRVRDGRVVSLYRLLDGREVGLRKTIRLKPLPKNMPQIIDNTEVCYDKKSQVN